MFPRTLLITLAIWTCLAHAQVYKCTDASGNTVYSDQSCELQDATGKPLQGARTADQMQVDRERALQATEQKYERRAAERAQQRNDLEKELLQQRQDAPLQAIRQNPADSPACRDAQESLAFVSSIRTLPEEERRIRTNAAIANVNAACGSHTPLMQEPDRLIVYPTSPANDAPILPAQDPSD